MRNLRQRGTAFVLALVVGLGMVMSSTPAYAAGSDRAREVRCRNIERAIAAATANLGADAELTVYLQGLFDANCR